MVVGDLFSGIGGFSLAAEWMGWRTVWFSEIDPFASRVLAHHWPDVPNHGDITRIDWTTVEPVDVLTGGFPCQPHSLAGLRKGSHDDRDLFDEIIRAAGVLRPRYLVLENVPGLFTSDRGRFFGRVLGSVAALGYDAEWRVLSAADVGAPHRRERVWITAYANGERHESGAHAERWPSESVVSPDTNGDDGRTGRTRRSHSGGARERESERALPVVADAARHGLGRSRQRTVDGGSRGGGDERFRADSGEAVADAEEQSERAGLRAHESRRIGRGRSGDGGGAHDPDAIGERLERIIEGRPASGTVDRSSDGRDRSWWRTEPDVGRVAYGVPARVDRLRCLGNSIVPQCALEIFRDIEARDVRVAA